MGDVLFAIWAACMAFGGWALICNERTYRQSIRLIDLVFAQDDWQRLRDEMHRVSYNRHWLALVTFRDPFKLYPQAVRDLLP